MISKVECVMLECDNCKQHYENGSGFALFSDEHSMREDATDDDWKLDEIPGKHYCDECYSIGENDEFYINESREDLHSVRLTKKN